MDLSPAEIAARAGQQQLTEDMNATEAEPTAPEEADEPMTDRTEAEKAPDKADEAPDTSTGNAATVAPAAEAHPEEMVPEPEAPSGSKVMPLMSLAAPGASAAPSPAHARAAPSKASVEHDVTMPLVVSKDQECSLLVRFDGSILCKALKGHDNLSQPLHALKKYITAGLKVKGFLAIAKLHEYVNDLFRRGSTSRVVIPALVASEAMSTGLMNDHWTSLANSSRTTLSQNEVVVQELARKCSDTLKVAVLESSLGVMYLAPPASWTHDQAMPRIWERFAGTAGLVIIARREKLFRADKRKGGHGDDKRKRAKR